MKYQLLPPLSDDDRAALEASIVQHGVLVPVEYDEDGEILDGHHRVAICESLGLFDWPRFVRKGLSEEEKRTLARELNVSRRHLTAAQKRDLIADQLRDTPSISSRAIAAMLGAHHSTVEKVRKQLVDGGEISHHEEIEGRDGVVQPARKAIRTAFLPEPDNARELMATAKAIRTRQREHSRQVRTDLINAIAERGVVTAGAMPRAAFPIVYADPPWEQEAWSDETGQDKGLRYPPMPLDAIKALCAGDRSPATRDALLFLWVNTNRLDDGIDVLRAWGFDYVTAFVWDKVDIGMGRWLRDQHETLLLGKRGNFPAPLPGTQAPSVHREKKGEHSRKPVHFAEMIERLYPDMKKLELFQRAESLAEDDPRRNGMWSFWGFEADHTESFAPPAGERIRSAQDGAKEPAPATGQPPVGVGSPKLPLPPSAGGPPTEFSVGGMKKGSSARFAVRQTEKGTFEIGLDWNFKMLSGGGSPFHRAFGHFPDALAYGLDALRLKCTGVLADRGSVVSDHHRAAARAAIRWIDAKADEWGVFVPSCDRDRGSPRPSVTKAEFDEYKALGAIDGGVLVVGKDVDALAERGLIVQPNGRDQHARLTEAGVSRLVELELAVREASDEDGGVHVRGVAA